MNPYGAQPSPQITTDRSDTWLMWFCSALIDSLKPSLELRLLLPNFLMRAKYEDMTYCSTKNEQISNHECRKHLH